MRISIHKMPHWAHGYPWESIYSTCEMYGLDPYLVGAIIRRESSGVRFAVRFEPYWFEKPDKDLHFLDSYAKKLKITRETEKVLQCSSHGLMQILGVTARSVCHFDEHLTMLYEIDEGIYWGCLYLYKQLDRYDGNLHDAIAAYNRGSVVRDLNGKYKNQEYVDFVIRSRKDLLTSRNG